MAESRAAAFERVFRAEYGSLVGFCFRRVDDYELAQDLTGETFRIAWTRWDEPRRSDRAWLFGVARNLIGNEYARRATRRTDPMAERWLESVDERSGRGFDAVEVQAVLRTLVPTHQEVLQATYWDGLSAAETAESLGATTAAVWVRLTGAARVRFRLACVGARCHLDKDGFMNTPDALRSADPARHLPPHSQLIDGYINVHLDGSTLSPARIAGAFGLSVRSIHAAYDGTTSYRGLDHLTATNRTSAAGVEVCITCSAHGPIWPHPSGSATWTTSTVRSAPRSGNGSADSSTPIAVTPRTSRRLRDR